MTTQKTCKFGRESRLGSVEMERVFTSGRKTVGRDLIVWALNRPKGERGPRRLGISISRKVGSAVRRNRLKRLARESFRLHRERLREGVDLAVYPRPGCRWEGLRDAETSFLDLCRKAGLIKHA